MVKVYSVLSTVIVCALITNILKKYETWKADSGHQNHVFLPVQLKAFVMETLFVAVCLLLSTGALILRERCDFVCSVIMQSTTDFCMIPALFLALLLLQSCFHVPI